MSELMVQSALRDEWAHNHGFNLPHYDSHLTATQAALINSRSTIDIYTGSHGFPFSDRVTPSAMMLRMLTTQKEFDAAAEVVEGMTSEDALFMECPGYKQQRPDSWTLTLPPDFNAKESEIWHREMAESQRAELRVNAWYYAAWLAGARNIQIKYADMDAYENNCVDAIAQLPRGNHLRRDVWKIRAMRARNIVKDYLLRRIQVDDMNGLEPIHRRAVILFGAGGPDKQHEKDLEEAFGRMYLNVNIRRLPISTPAERLEEAKLSLTALGFDVSHL
jgi:hypothetical protein